MQTIGKSPAEDEGYAPDTVSSRTDSTASTVGLGSEGRDTTQITHDHADDWMRELAETRQKRTGRATAVRGERAAIGAGLAASGSRRPSGRCGVRSAVVCYRSTEIPTGEVAVQSYPRATGALGPVERLAGRADDHRVALLTRDAQFGPRVSLVAGVEQPRLRARDHAGRTSCRTRVTRPASGTRVASSNRSVESRHTPSSVPSKGHIWTVFNSVTLWSRSGSAPRTGQARDRFRRPSPSPEPRLRSRSGRSRERPASRRGTSIPVRTRRPKENRLTGASRGPDSPPRTAEPRRRG